MVVVGIPSPYPRSFFETVDDEDTDEGEDDGFDEGGSAFARLDPDEPEDLGGDEVDPEDEEDDHSDTGFGIGMFLFPPIPLKMA